MKSLAGYIGVALFAVFAFSMQSAAVDKTALQDLVTWAESYYTEEELSRYTAVSVYVYRNTLFEAKLVLLYDFVYPHEVDNAIYSLELAISRLERNPPEKGDADHNGRINVADIIVIRDHILGTARLTDQLALWAADANSDGVINIFDMLTIRDVILRNALSETPSQSALPPTALPKGEPRVSYTNSVCHLASPFGRGVMR
ncbi:MAG: dockerin type I repeat-containing protein [Oscillospiraceae bacterium]|nr:dockerin type I repeat-containing protein [Oscillospiraceae bacterium]